MLDWSKLCGRQDANFTIWNKNDFGHCFEQLAIISPCHLLFALITVCHLIRHRHRAAVGQIPHSLVLYLRFAVAVGLTLLPLLLLLLSFLYEKIHPSPVDILSWILRALAWLLHSNFVWRLRKYYHIHVRGPTSLIFSFLLTTASIIIQLRTVINHMINKTSYFDPSETYITFVTAGFHFFYLKSLIPWRRPPIHIYFSAYQSINDSTEQEVADRFRGYGSISSLQEELGHADDSACLLSRLTFWWVNPLMLHGYEGNLSSPRDLFSLPARLRTITVDTNFSHHFDLKPTSASSSIQDNEVEIHSHSPRHKNVLKALNNTFGLEYYPLGILKFVADGLGFAGPLILNLLVTYLENPKEPVWHGYVYACGLFLSTLLSSVLSTQFNYHVSIVGLKIRAALITTIYKKSLKISNATMSKSNTGEIVNFMSTDTDRIVNFCPSFHAFWSLPVQTAVSLYLLYTQVGWAFLAGLGFTLLVIPINRWLAIKIGQLSTDMMMRKDLRVKVMNEILNGIRVIKMYTWEDHFKRRIAGLRDSELKSLRGRKYLDALCVYFWATTPVLISILTFTTYALMGHVLTAAKVFTSMALFAMLIMPLNAFPWVINGLMEAWVSVKRLQRFLLLEDLNWEQYYTQTDDDEDIVLDISNGSFDWNMCADRAEVGTESEVVDETVNWSSTSTKEQSSGILKLHNINLNIKKGMLVGVTGRVGSGKSTLLNAIQGELRHTSGTLYVADLEAGFGLASQEAWIQHATIRDNILSGSSYQMDFYESVLEACALHDDLKILPAGDLTEVGQNGITLSGGQKARISLARAVYQDKDLYLLDDPFAAVDAHVARHLYQHCIMGLLQDKTRILCTHHVQYLQEADLVIFMDAGTISRLGSPEEVLADMNLDCSLKSSSEEEIKSDDKNNVTAISERGDLVQEEEKDTGVVKLHVYKAYWKAVGSYLAPLILTALFFMQASRNISDWWLSYWVTHAHRASNNHSENYVSWPVETWDYFPVPGGGNISWRNVSDNAEDNIKFYLTIYASLAAANSCFTFIRAFLFAYGGIQAASVVHKSLLARILKAPISFFEVTPIGRILNRFSSDMYAIDDSLPFMLNIFLAQLYGVIGTLIITCYGLPWFIIILVPLCVIYFFIQKYYRQTSREIKRITSITLSPVYAHFSETLSGLGTIRALRHVARFEAENRARLEDNQKAMFAGQAASLWLAVRLQVIGVAMVTGVALIAVLEHHFHSVNAGLVGLALSYALSVTALLNGVVTSFTETEKQMVCLERAYQYINDVPAESEWALLNVPPHWPTQGCITFWHVSLQYRQGQPRALNNVSFETGPAEKIGIVGRTGSGKSSLFSTLFRMIEIQSGQILIDGVDIKHLPLTQLRSRLAVIPQDPFLFSGSIRENLDPTSTYADHELWDVLKTCHLHNAVQSMGGIDAEVGEKGCRLSVGQRQLLCLARALLIRAKVLCIDEATASVDQETDTLIQKMIREEFTDQTVLTIAHRIKTILDSDRVIVMSEGTVAEFGPPDRLLQDPNSVFHGLVHGKN